MKTKFLQALLLLALCFSAHAGTEGRDPREIINDIRGIPHRPFDTTNKAGAVLIFYWHDCPICNAYAPEINRICSAYTNFSFYIVQVDPDLTVEKAQKHAKDFGLVAPVLLDGQHHLVKLAGAKATPEAIIFVKDMNVLYRGRIDNLYPSLNKRRLTATQHDLRDALDAIAQWKAHRHATTAHGMRHSMNLFSVNRIFPISVAALFAGVSARAADAPTFNKDIAPVVFKDCAICHRPGEVAPFSLLNYRDVSKRAKQIARVTSEEIMPPWKAEEGFGEFANDRHLTPQQITLFRDWLKAGEPEGAASDLPPAPKFPTGGWTLGTPDLVLEPDEAYTLAAEGPDIYRCFVVPTKLADDHYIAAIEVQPGNRKVVHHVIVHFDTTGQARELDAKDPGPGYTAFGGIGFKSGGMIGGWAPGNYPTRLPDGIGRLLPKNADIVLQVHYHRSGKVEKDRTRIALYFAKGAVDKRIRSFPLAKFRLRIPADDSNYVVHASLPVRYDVTAYRVTPHMHLLGKDMKVTATLPDGTLVPLVYVKNWDFNWQTGYEFKTPIHLPKGSRVDLEAHYDNSTNNPVNPNDPPRLVTWGEQTTDEMCIAFLSFTLDREHLTRAGAANRGSSTQDEATP